MLLMHHSSVYADLQMFVTFLSMIAFEETVKPQFLALVAKGMTELPTEVCAGPGSLVQSDLVKMDMGFLFFSFFIIKLQLIAVHP